MFVRESVSPWAPDEPEPVLMLERLVMAGANLSFLAYGVVVTLFFLCVSYLRADLDRKRGWTTCLLVYVTLVFLLSSVSNAANMRFTQSAYIDNRNFPGGPAAYGNATIGSPVNLVGTGAAFASTWLQDGLLLYRFYIIWSFNLCMIFAAALFLASVVLSCLLLAQLCLPGATLWAQSHVGVALAYWSTSVATNIVLTLLIAGRLTYMRRKMTRATGRSAIGSQHLSIAAMLVESAALYSAVAVPFMVTYAKAAPSNFLFFWLLGQVQGIASLLIILRVAQGRAWTRMTESQQRAHSLRPLSGDIQLVSPISPVSPTRVRVSQIAAPVRGMASMSTLESANFTTDEPKLEREGYPHAIAY